MNDSGNGEQDIPTNEDDSEEEDGSNVILAKAPTMNFQPEKSMDGNDFPP